MAIIPVLPDELKADHPRMSKISLRAAFTLAAESPVAAQQVFTNRVTEVGAFDEAVRALGNTLSTSDISPVVNRGIPRRNVLVYYGVGGIGKTTLSEELERRFTGPPGGDRDREHAAVRFDFAQSAAFDMESYVLRLRASLGHLAHHWHAFDVAFSVYWERAHPGEPLDDFISRDTALRRTARRIGLSEQIAATLTDAFGAAMPGVVRAAHALTGLLYTEARRAVIEHRILKNCELLAELLEADADVETLSYFPYLLAWDLDRLPPPHPRALVLLDTFEEVTARPTREMERWLQRSVFLMPNVLFVITGRNRLDWADLRQATDLDFVGTHRWPLLHAGQAAAEPRQHLVGYLSATDAEFYLVTALTQDDQPVIPAGIRQRIVAASDGLPLYLDLAVTLYLDILAKGETPVEEQFGQPLPEVCGRILRDLERDERGLLRAAALLDTFNPDMLRAACPQVPDSAVARFINRPFLELDPDRTWPYALHATLREAIREADRDLRDSWSPRERAEAANRIGGYLEQSTRTAAGSGDRSTQVAAVGQAIRLCQLTGQLFDWLPGAAQQLLTCGGWGLLPDLPADDDSPVSGLILGLQGARERRSGHLDSAITTMDAALARLDLPPSLHQFLLLHRAHALRVAGRYAAASDDYQQLLQGGGDFVQDAAYWLADYHFLQGRFEEALSSLDELTGLPAELRGEVLRLKGHVYRVNALTAQAEAAYRQALELARQTANTAAEGKALTDLIQTLCWVRPGEAQELQPHALEVNQALRNQVEIVKINAAAAVALTQLGNLDEASTLIDAGLHLTQQCGYRGGTVWCQVARALNQLTRGDIDASRRTAAHLAATVADLQGNQFWSEIVNWWTGYTGSPPPARTTNWLDGEDTVKARWLAIPHSPSTGQA
jgi:tetratricopeptide (TPR) repeat protein